MKLDLAQLEERVTVEFNPYGYHQVGGSNPPVETSFFFNYFKLLKYRDCCNAVHPLLINLFEDVFHYRFFILKKISCNIYQLSCSLVVHESWLWYASKKTWATFLLYAWNGIDHPRLVKMNPLLSSADGNSRILCRWWFTVVVSSADTL